MLEEQVIHFGENSTFDFGVSVISIGGGDLDEIVTVQKNAESDYISGNPENYLYNVVYDEPISFSFTVGNCNAGEPIDIMTIRSLNRWMFATKKYRWMEIENYDGTYTMCYKAVAVKSTETKLPGGETVAITYDIITSAGFGWSKERSETISCNGTTELKLYNESDDGENVYPVIEFTFHSNTPVSVNNASDGDSTLKFSTIGTLETPMVVDAQHMVAELGTSVPLGAFNFVFPKLVPGENVWKLTGNFDMKVTWRDHILLAP